VTEACVFCEIVAGREPASIVWEDARAIAFMDLRQPNPGHVLVIPRAHIVDILALDDETGAALMAGTARVARAVARGSGPRASTSGSRRAPLRARKSFTCIST